MSEALGVLFANYFTSSGGYCPLFLSIVSRVTTPTKHIKITANDIRLPMALPSDNICHDKTPPATRLNANISLIQTSFRDIRLRQR